VNSLEGNPEPERAAIAAEGPGMGMTGIFSVAHSLACKTWDTMLSIKHINENTRLTWQGFEAVR
jgi:hypothetical protein